MKTRWTLPAVLCALFSFATIPAAGQLIDFEHLPAGGPSTDDFVLNTPYNLSGGGTVAFFFDENLNNSFDPGIDSFGAIERVGNLDPNPGFANSTTLVDDTANGGLAVEAQLGTFFLRQLQPGAVPKPFIVDYNTAATISALHGEIWDIDGTVGATEQWFVDILDASNNVLNSQTSPLGNSLALDGLPWDFVFTGLPAGVDKIRITFNTGPGSKTSGLGLAFNNFDPFNAPEPGTMVLAGMGIIAVLAGRVAGRKQKGGRCP